MLQHVKDDDADDANGDDDDADDGNGDDGNDDDADDDDDLNVALHHVEVGERLAAKTLLRLQHPVLKLF